MSNTLYFMHHAPAPRRPHEIVGSGIDRDLDEYGIFVAHLQADRLRRNIDTGVVTALSRMILSSPLRRATQTAEILADQNDMDVVIEQDMTAQHFGELEGKTFAEIDHDPRLIVHMWDHIDPADRDTHQVPGGESNRAFADRILAACSSIRRRSTNNPLIITHGSVMDTLIGYHLGRRLDEVEGLNRKFEGRILADTSDGITALGRDGEQFLHIPGTDQYVERCDLIGLQGHVEAYAAADSVPYAEQVHLRKLASFITRN